MFVAFFLYLTYFRTQCIKKSKLRLTWSPTREQVKLPPNSPHLGFLPLVKSKPVKLHITFIVFIFNLHMTNTKLHSCVNTKQKRLNICIFLEKVVLVSTRPLGLINVNPLTSLGGVVGKGESDRPVCKLYHHGPGRQSPGRRATLRCENNTPPLNKEQRAPASY